MRLNSKAVSPLIATIILIAVTLAVAVIVVAWIFGLFGTSMGPTEKLQIFQDARLVSTGSGVTFNVTIKNTGTTVVQIQRVYIKELPTCTTDTVKNATDNSQLKPISSGQAVTIRADFTCSGVQPGITYNVVILTAAGNAYTVPVTAESG